jgi:hypothetical protein
MGDGCHRKWVGGDEVVKEGGVDVRPLWEVDDVPLVV